MFVNNKREIFLWLLLTPGCCHEKYCTKNDPNKRIQESKSVLDFLKKRLSAVCELVAMIISRNVATRSVLACSTFLYYRLQY